MAFMKRSRLMIKLVALVAASLTWPAAVATATPAQEAYVKFANPGGNENFGWSVAVSGDTVVVGADGEPSSATGVDGDQSDTNAPNSGAAYVFVRDGTTWSQQAYLKASNAEGASPDGTKDGDHFGSSVTVDGNIVAVGA